MENPFILLGIFIGLSFLYMDRTLAGWKKEQDEKLTEIQDTLDELKTDFDKNFRNEE